MKYIIALLLLIATDKVTAPGKDDQPEVVKRVMAFLHGSLVPVCRSVIMAFITLSPQLPAELHGASLSQGSF